jgi:hypothetical protein
MKVVMEALSQIDLAFCMDHTNSMTPFISTARSRIAAVLTALEEIVQADLHAAVVAYRDYGDGPPVVEVRPFQSSPAKVRRSLQSLAVASPQGNTDAAEAVFAGLLACCNDLQWRPQAIRVLMLIGDAPPHGCGANAGPYPDRFPNGDASGANLMNMGARVEAAGITLYSLAMVPSVHPLYDPVVAETFGWLAQTTGGCCQATGRAADAMNMVEAIAQRAGKQMDFDRRLWERLTTKAGPAPTAAQIDDLTSDLADTLGVAPFEVHSSVERLRKRRVLEDRN